MDKWEDTYYPACRDSGKKVELLLRNGTSVIGKIPFSEHRKWRFV